MNNDDRLKAGKHQLRYFLANQYPMWRVVMVKSIRKILDDLDSFYAPIHEEIKSYDDEILKDTEHCEIRNGLFFEALSQSIQAVEDLFSLMRNCGDLAYFAKNVLTYKAHEITQYIRKFDIENLEFVLNEFHVPYFSPIEPWENAEVFAGYCDAVALIQKYLRNLIAHHKKFYFHYCQYKHGLSVALRPFGEQPKVGNEVNVHEGCVMAFDNVHFNKRYNLQPSAMMIPDFHPNISGNITALHDEHNLLRADLRVVNINVFIEIVEQAYTLLSVLHKNLSTQCDVFNESDIVEFAFPTKDYKRQMIIGFPVDN